MPSWKKKYLSFFRNQWFLIASMLILIGLIQWIKPNEVSIKNALQKQFLDQEFKLYHLKENVTKEWFNLSSEKFQSKYNRTDKNLVHFHIYKNDSLIYWNSNQLPIKRLASLHFPFEGLAKLQNGIYYNEIARKKGFTFVFSIPLQSEYNYENEHLSKEMLPPFSRYPVELSLQEIPGKMIISHNKKTVFSIKTCNLVKAQAIYNQSSLALFITLLFYVFAVFAKKARANWLLLSFPLFFMSAVYLLVQNGRIMNIIGIELSDPQLLAIGTLCPNYLSFVLWICTLCFVQLCFHYILKKQNPLSSSIVTLINLLFATLIIPLILALVIENSSINFSLSNIFKLNSYFYVSIGVLAFVYGICLKQIAYFIRLEAVSKRQKLQLLGPFVLLCIFPLIYLSQISFGDIIYFFLPIVIIFFKNHIINRVGTYSYILITLVITGIAFVEIIESSYELKERENAEIYLNELSQREDLTTELEFTSAKEKLLSETYFNRFLDILTKPNFFETKEALERRIFNGFWDRYDVDFYTFSSTNEQINQMTLPDFEKLFKKGRKSDLDSSLVYLKDNDKNWTYLARCEITRENQSFLLFTTFASKRVPEEIGFPRLLISSQTNVLEPLSEFSMANYVNNQLKSSKGTFDYPEKLSSLQRNRLAKERSVFDGREHFYQLTSDNVTKVISKLSPTWMSRVTALAFIVVFFGVGLLIFFPFFSEGPTFQRNELSLSNKIQIALLFLVIVSLISFSIGSASFIRNSYDQNNYQIVEEKLNSVHGSLEQLFKSRMFSSFHGDELNFQLRQLGKTFHTDINIYDSSGFLSASSRPKIFHLGILGERMNAHANYAMRSQKKIKLITTEAIGKLNYLSGYLPLKLSKKETIYVNLQHFNQQGEIEEQFRTLIMAIINVFMLLLVLTVVIALLVSNWITSPLRLIRESLVKTELGKSTNKIDYHRNDEVGDLVKEYNRKLDELEKAVNQLAQSERETAWREMAKQVAHEIKNPLTPMKLSIQHLQRAFDPNDPKSKDKIDRVSNSIIEQIEALTTIANSFSNFAKMPQPKFETIYIDQLLHAAIDLFENNERISIKKQFEITDAKIYGDKEMLLRVFTNLITNGIQAVDLNSSVKMKVRLFEEMDVYKIHIEDNGTGIPNEQLTTIFEPYFTTKSTGTGLGLAMVKQIVEGHNGSVSVIQTNSTGTIMEVIISKNNSQ